MHPLKKKKSKKIDHGILRINIRDVHMKIVINQKTDILTQLNGREKSIK